MSPTLRAIPVALVLLPAGLVAWSWFPSVSQEAPGSQPAAPGAAAGPPPAPGMAPPSPARPGPGTPRLPVAADKVVEYRIEARLDREKKQLQGRERVTWRNPSQDTVGELWLHLYLNAFKNSKSTFNRESGGQLRRDRMAEDGWGYIDITSFRLADGTDLEAGMRFEAPDDGNADDQTVVRVPLPAAIAPGASVTLDIEFLAQLPRVFARTGYKDDFYMVGQWFPKLGVYEPAGLRGRATGGWNCHQFHANSEFYADYGRFEVEMTVPGGFVLGATGERTSRRENADGTVTYVHVQDDVHDFAWTASPHYIEQRQVFSAATDVSAEEYARVAQLVDRPVDEVRLSDVEIIVLVQPPHRSQADRYFASAKAAIKWFGLWYGRYPYRTLTVVDPAPGAGGAGGMEYPTLITGGTSFLFGSWPLDGVRALEMVTVHEFGHNFWYGLVGSNEFEEAWLDEGVNSYSTAKVLDVAYGPAAMVDIPMLQLSAHDGARLSNSPRARFDRVRQPAWTYSPGRYSFYSYQKPELLLRTLELHLGDALMARVMRTYHERWRFRHPSSDDFYAVVNEVTGRDFAWYFDQAVESASVLDYAISSASSRRVRPDTGHLDGESGRTFVSDKDVRERDAQKGDPAGPYESVVIVNRLGEFVFPVEIALKFEGKDVERLQWDGRDTWKRFRFVRPEKLEWADIDPDRKVPLDVNWLNNGRRVEADGTSAARASLNWLGLVQGVVAGLGW
jgi:hypothetical protein